MPKICPHRRLLLTQLGGCYRGLQWEEEEEEVGGLLLLFHLVSCYLLGFCQGPGSRQVYIPSPPLPIRGLMSITRGKIPHYCQSESAAVTLAHVMQSLMH